jgi:hypothetical protein
MLYFRGIIVVILVFAGTLNSYSQYSFTKPSTKDFPTVFCGFYNNNPNNYYTAADFEVRENGLIIPESLVEVICENSMAPIQVLLLIDQSTSMSQWVNGKPKIDIVKNSAISFINKVNLTDFSAVGILGFGSIPNLYSNFTNDKNQLNNKLSVMGTIPSSTNFNNAFLDPTKGAIALLKKQPNENRCIIFLTDGNHDEEIQGVFRSWEVSSALNQNNIKLYSISFLSNYNSSLKSISTEYYQVDETGGLPEVYDKLAYRLTNYPFCNIIWQSQIPCESEVSETQVSIKYKPDNNIFNTSYSPPESAVFHLNTDKNSYYFGNPEPNQYTEQYITFTPTPYDIHINQLYPANPGYFEILDFGNGLTVMPAEGIDIKTNQSLTIKISFTQKIDKTARTSDLIVEGYPCDKVVKLYGGLGNITITNPIENDIYSVCNSVKIKWFGVANDALKDLYYKDKNSSWKIIANDVQGDEYLWKDNLPEGPCYIKIIAHLDLGSEITLQDSTDEFFIETPELTSQSSSINKDSVIVGSNQTTPYIDYIQNEYHFPLKIINWIISGTYASEYSIEDINGLTVEPGSKISLVVSFKPLDFGNRPATLTIMTDCGKPLIIKLECYGLCSAITKEEVNFGNVFIETQQDSIVEMILVNAMNKTIIFTPFMSGANKNDFKIIGVYPGEKISVPPYMPYTLKLGFAPKTLGNKSAYINFPIEGCRTVKTKLLGKSIREGLTMNSLDFGRLLYKSTFPTLDISIINKDSDSLELISLALIDESLKPIFQLADSIFPRYLKGNDTLIIPVNFIPTDVEKYSADLQLISSMNDTLLATLRGEVFLPSLKLETICANSTPIDSSGISFLLMINDGLSSDVRIHSYNFAYSTNEFSWLFPPMEDFTIGISDTMRIPIIYKPNSAGSHQTEFIVEADNYDYDFTSEWKSNVIEMICEKAQFESSIIDSQTVLICDEILVPIRLTNLSNTLPIFVNLDKAVISGIDSQSYRLIETGTRNITANSTDVISLKFKALHRGLHIAHLTIPVSTGNNMELDIHNYGELLDAVSDISEVTIIPGEEFSAVITITAPNITKDSIDFISTSVAYNSEMLYFLEADQAIGAGENLKTKYWTITPNPEIGQVNFEYQGKLPKSGIYNITPKFLSLLSDKKPSYLDIYINYPCFIDTNLSINVRRGEICMDDMRNVIIGATDFYVNPPIPNPTNGDFEINFNIGIKAKTVISIFNLNGKLIKVLADEVLNAGVYSKKYNIFSLPNGSYYLELKCAGFSRTYLLVKES